MRCRTWTRSRALAPTLTYPHATECAATPEDCNARPDIRRPGVGTLSAEHRAVVWRSRRGMLELDQQLHPFAVHCYGTLPTEQQRSFCRLLAMDDVDILDSLFCGCHPDSELSEIIKQVRDFSLRSR